MKKTLTIISLLAGAVGVYAQGQMSFTDYVGTGATASQEFEISIYSPQVASPGTQLSGNGPANANNTYVSPSNPGNLPGGTQTGYTGTAIGGSATGSGPTGYGNGNNYTVGLYYAAGANQPLSSLTLVPGATSTFYATGGTGLSGQFKTTATITIPGIPNGSAGTFELRAWYSGGGAATYAAALTAGVPAGEDPAVNITLASPPATASSLNPLQSFNLTTTVPEPSTIALGVMGASAFLFRRRK
jgi:hypothetical protein